MHPVQPALHSPFGRALSAALTPPAALCKRQFLRTRLYHRFYLFRLRSVYTGRLQMSTLLFEMLPPLRGKKIVATTALVMYIDSNS